MESLFVNSEPIIFRENIKEHFSKLFDELVKPGSLGSHLAQHSIGLASSQTLLHCD